MSWGDEISRPLSSAGGGCASVCTAQAFDFICVSVSVCTLS